MTLKMITKLVKLCSFELKRKFFNSIDWISNGLFLLVNITIFPFTVNPNTEILNHLFLSVIITSILLGIVLTTIHVFDEDVKDGSLNQYILFGASIPIIYLSKVIVASIEFALIITLILPFSTILYSIEFGVIFKIWLTILLSIPLISSISIFGSMLTLEVSKNTAISILLIFPLLISSLIGLSLATENILHPTNISNRISYIEINLGFTMIMIPILSWLSKFLYKS